MAYSPRGVYPILPDLATTNQVVIAVTGTAVQFPANAVNTNVFITNNSTSGNSVILGGSTVANTQNGSGGGYILPAAATIPWPVNNTSSIWLQGTAGDFVSFVLS